MAALVAIAVAITGPSAAAGASKAAVSKPKPGVPSLKKAIWGPLTLNGSNAFARYRALGAGIFMYQLRWSDMTETRPEHPDDPGDPAYRWPADLDTALDQARLSGMRVFVRVTAAPGWSNGGRDERYVPGDPDDLATFMATASRRYPRVKYWDVWEETTRDTSFMPLTPERRGRPLSPESAAAPRLYARMLDTAYAALKRVDPSDIVVGGNSFVTGDISPRNFIANLRLPNGRPPRMDMYAHNAFSGRKPSLAKPPLGNGFADMSDLDTLVTWVDRNLQIKKKIPIFVSEFTLPTDHPNRLFNFWVTQKTQAEWTTAALKIVRGSSRFATLGWYSVADEAADGTGQEIRFGLVDAAGRPKPAYNAFRAG